MPELHSRLGTWDLPNVHAWSDRTLVMRAPEHRIVMPDTRVATRTSFRISSARGDFTT